MREVPALRWVAHAQSRPNPAGSGEKLFDDCVPEWSDICRDTLTMRAADFVKRETRPELAGSPQGRLHLG